MKKLNLEIRYEEILSNGDKFQWTGEKYIKINIMSLPFWRLGGLERVDASIEIDEALDKDSLNPEISNDSCKLLSEAMRLEGVNVQMTEDGSRFHRRLMREILTAKLVERT